MCVKERQRERERKKLVGREGENTDTYTQLETTLVTEAAVVRRYRYKATVAQPHHTSVELWRWVERWGGKD